MDAVKVTFTLDRRTIIRLQDAAQRLAKPKSQVVREAIQDYQERIGQLRESERLRLLRTVDEIMARPATRPQAEVAKELRALRRARRSGGRRSPGENSR